MSSSNEGIPSDVDMEKANAAWRERMEKRERVTDKSQIGSFKEHAERAYKETQDWRDSIGRSDLNDDFEVERKQREGVISKREAESKLPPGQRPVGTVGRGGAHPMDVPGSSMPMSATSSTSSEHSHLAAATDGDDERAKMTMAAEVRSVVDFSARVSQIVAQWMRAAGGSQGCLVSCANPLSYALGFRDMKRGFDRDDRGNHVRLFDPFGAGTLSMGIMAAAAWQMHVEDLWNIEAPIKEYLPELPDSFSDTKNNGITVRDILSFRCGMSDRAVLKSFGIQQGILPWYSPSALSSQHERIFEPLMKVLDGSAAPKNAAAILTYHSDRGQIQRQALVAHLANKQGPFSSSSALRRLPLTSSSPRVSHFALALVATAMERAMSKHHNQIVSFEQAMLEGLFKHKEASSVGYGVPQKINKSKTFYEPEGITSGHFGPKHVIPSGLLANAAPPVFNGSLNVFGKAEDLAGLVCASFDSVHEAVSGEYFPPEDGKQSLKFGERAKQMKQQMPQKSIPSGVKEAETPRDRQTGKHKLSSPPDPGPMGVPKQYCELTFLVNPSQNRYWHSAPIRGSGLSTPFTGSATYIPKQDVGAFVVLNGGSRRARLVGRMVSAMLARYYVEHVYNPLQKQKAEQASGHSTEGVDAMKLMQLPTGPLPTSEQEWEVVAKQALKKKSWKEVTAETIREGQFQQFNVKEGFTRY